MERVESQIILCGARTFMAHGKRFFLHSFFFGTLTDQYISKLKRHFIVFMLSSCCSPSSSIFYDYYHYYFWLELLLLFLRMAKFYLHRIGSTDRSLPNTYWIKRAAKQLL